MVSVIMDSQSDWSSMKLASDALAMFGIEHECLIVSAHRTPHRLYDYAKKVAVRGVKIIIAGAGGAAHLPGMVASTTHLPVIGVPIKSSALSGVDSLYSIVQMPKGVPVATMAIGDAGAQNAGLFAARILAMNDDRITTLVHEYMRKLSDSVPHSPESN